MLRESDGEIADNGQTMGVTLKTVTASGDPWNCSVPS